MSRSIIEFQKNKKELRFWSLTITLEFGKPAGSLQKTYRKLGGVAGMSNGTYTRPGRRYIELARDPEGAFGGIFSFS